MAHITPVCVDLHLLSGGGVGIVSDVIPVAQAVDK